MFFTNRLFDYNAYSLHGDERKMRGTVLIEPSDAEKKPYSGGFKLKITTKNINRDFSFFKEYFNSEENIIN
jgi:hypothetical protein